MAEVKIKTIIGKKMGMTQIFDDKGDMVPVTIIEAGPCTVVAKKTSEKAGYAAVQLGFLEANKKLSKPLAGQFKKVGEGKGFKFLKEVRVNDPAAFEIGEQVKADIFAPGEYVKVSGRSIGKGFAGTVKRYHFTRGPMAHGSKSHRRPGSIGAGTTPGHVIKGLRMAGRMGNANVTLKNVKVVKVDADKNLILLSGAVPGKPGSIVLIKG